MEFKKIKLGKLLVNHDRKRVPLSSREREKHQGIYPYYGAASIMDYVDDYIFDGKFILLGEDGTVINEDGTPVLQIAEGKFWCNNHAHVLTNSALVDFDYLYYLLKGTNISSIVTGAVQKKISQSNMNNLEVEIIDGIDEQKRAVSFLKSLDEKIAVNSSINSILQEQADTFFWKEMGEYILEKKELPLGWKKVSVSEIDVLVTDYVANGSFQSLADNVTYLDEETDNVLIRLTDYNNDYASNMVYLSDDSYEFLAKSKLYGDEIIISNVGANVGTVFRCPRLKKKMSLGPNAILLRSDTMEHFLYLYFMSDFGQGMLKSIVTGSAQPKFNKTSFRALKVVVPDEETLAKINSVYSSMYEMIAENNSENQMLKHTRDAMIMKLLKGEVEL